MLHPKFWKINKNLQKWKKTWPIVIAAISDWRAWALTDVSQWQISQHWSIAEGRTSWEITRNDRRIVLGNKVKVPVDGESYCVTSKKFSGVGVTRYFKKVTKVCSGILASYSNDFLPERDYVTFGSLLILLFQIRLSSVCLSSVTFVCPTQGVETFGNISPPFCTLAILWPPCKILQRSSQGNPSVGCVKYKRVAN